MLLFGPPIKETSPVGAAPEPDCGATVTLTFTAWPCVIVAGESVVNVVTDGFSMTELHLFTRLAAFTEPNPVARS